MQHQQQSLRRFLFALGLAIALPTLAQQPPAKPADEQVVVPRVERRDVPLPRFPSKDWEVSGFFGTYSTESFGASPVVGLRVGYHFSEDLFMQATLAQTKVSDETFRRILPGGIVTSDQETLRYINLSTGYNVLPGEVFIGRKRAKATAIYLIGGIGSTKFNDQRKQTINFGLGMRLMFADRWSVNVDLRDHVFPLDILGERRTTQNIELTTGVSYFF